MLKKSLAFLLAVFILSFNFALCSDFVEVEISRGKKDYSTSGGEEYKVKPTDKQLRAREAAKKAYTSEIGNMSVNIKPMFDNWITREAQAKINNIGTKIVLANDLDDFVRFSVSRKEIVNAYADYHGVVMVYKGLLQYVETEDELAYVLSHELGHIYKNDTRTKMIRRGASIGSVIAGTVLMGAGGNRGVQNAGVGVATAGLGGIFAEPKLSKFQEKRADLTGIDFMVKAGYNPLAAISMMNKILNRRWDIISSHPSGDKRMIAAYNYIVKNYPLYIDGGYDTISYERAMKYLNRKKSKKLKQYTPIDDDENSQNNLEEDI